MLDQARGVSVLVGRVIVGVIFIVHGWTKVTSTGLPGVSAHFQAAGIPAAGVAGPGIAILELVGGPALIVGAALPLFGGLLALTMVGAIVFVHGSHGFSNQGGGYEYVLALAGACVMLAFSGGGALAVDGLWRRRAAATAGPSGSGMPGAGSPESLPDAGSPEGLPERGAAVPVSGSAGGSSSGRREDLPE
ncbi:DoxX family protein [Planotetraspora sp. A-T 1434]|uniref:DoxX family protein n=1 Tax=Planotetraspora sp. A-T 1434 TaxID=2979219 RepID=UPI0021BFAC76|nr:DoxX family protein [Planotetraspora sp. A-T 1434]MCT9930200.1 DoxX family protein [Planotetraspora sp. A-T 1434]